ncbi:MAG: MFS transporter [Gluconacetobacter sp.]
MTPATERGADPLTGFHWRVFLAAACGYLFDGFDGASLPFFLPVIREQWGLSASALSFLASSTSQGYLVGSLCAGMLADRYGRKPIIMWALALFAAGSAASAFCRDEYSYFALRFLCGVGTGAEAVTLAPYLSEFLPVRYRASLCAAAVGFLSFGYFASSLLGYLVVADTAEGWRVASVVTALPVFILLYWRRALPESPEWLANRRTRPVTIRSKPDPISDRAGDQTARRKRTAASLTLTCLVWLNLVFSFYGFFTWLPTWLSHQNHSLSGGYRYSVAVYTAQIPGYFLFALAGRIFDPKAVMVACFLLGSFSLMFLNHAPQGLFQLLWCCGASACLAGGMGLVYAYTSAIYPTYFRATATGVAAAASRCGAIAATFGVGVILLNWGYGALPILLGTPLLLGALCVLFHRGDNQCETKYLNENEFG